MSVTRLLRTGDAARLTRLVVADREFLAPWDPARAESFYTEAGQQQSVERALTEHAAGLTWPGVIMDEHGQTVGRVTLFGIERGHSQSGRIGYWVAEQANGRGLAGAAVAELAATAFGELGLHRLEAATLVDNVRSQKVLRRNGFTQFGLAPAYTKIGGEWRDHALFQLVNDRG